MPLSSTSRALRPGGILAFESRNPEALAWEQWQDEPRTRDTPVGRLQESTVTDPPDLDGIVTMHCHNEFTDDHHVIDVDQRLQFRSHDRIRQDLAAAGLHLVATYSDWEHTPFQGGPSQPLMVFVASRP